MIAEDWLNILMNDDWLSWIMMINCEDLVLIIKIDNGDHDWWSCWLSLKMIIFISMHDDYIRWLMIRIDLWWLLIDYDHEWLWSLIMLIELLRWLVHGGYGWELIDDGWLRSWLMITENDMSLFMMIIIDDLNDDFIIDNYHDGWLIGDHMMMIMDRDYDLCRLIHVDCCWLIMMINVIGDLLMVIYHEWWLIIMIRDDLSLLIMTGHGWWLIDRLIDWLIDNKTMITRSVIIPKVDRPLANCKLLIWILYCIILD